MILIDQSTLETHFGHGDSNRYGKELREIEVKERESLGLSDG